MVGEPKRRPDRGFLNLEMAAAMFLLVVAVIPLGFSFVHERDLCRIYYVQAVATQIVDGEMECLVAGRERDVAEGTQSYAVKAEAARNLPPGKFLLTRAGRHLKLEWVADRRGWGGRIVREAELP
ncbi:MAG TPA: hypothetical protein P5186_28525 [Candidatus Paceibacterota bacterium]|nr:hypothetical protein [Verrucomicrobiota bacterium]HRY51994.1 hypothetical protein [Candidatus Paceibacterota bacterium]